jgi:hypothetical protein
MKIITRADAVAMLVERINGASDSLIASLLEESFEGGEISGEGTEFCNMVLQRCHIVNGDFVLEEVEHTIDDSGPDIDIVSNE